MYYSGIGDEAGQSIDVQIMAHHDLGWSHIELRLIDGENITAISDKSFDTVCAKLDAAELHVSCFGSAIANWSRPITCDPQIDIQDLARAIPRMKRLDTQYIRVMSYPNDPDNPIEEADWRSQSINRMKTLAKMAEDGGVTLVHENCSGWGGLSAENSNILLGEVNSPNLKVVFDTGNPVTYGQDAWEYYLAVQKDIEYVHIKDAKKIKDNDVYTFCGEGEGYVREILADLLGKGYDSGISIEPHLAAVIHTGERADDDARLYESYTEYGRRLMKIVESVAPKAAAQMKGD